jgi:hypothetical protein
MKLLMNRHMQSHGFGRGSVSHGLGRGMGHQDYSLHVARPPGIMSSSNHTSSRNSKIFFVLIKIILILINVILSLM